MFGAIEGEEAIGFPVPGSENNIDVSSFCCLLEVANCISVLSLFCSLHICPVHVHNLFWKEANDKKVSNVTSTPVFLLLTGWADRHALLSCIYKFQRKCSTNRSISERYTFGTSCNLQCRCKFYFILFWGVLINWGPVSIDVCSVFVHHYCAAWMHLCCDRCELVGFIGS